jgi:DNA-binding MarR family transcriptional regulator
VLFRIRRLERRGHARRTANPEDGRSFLIGLTPEGDRLLREARPSFRAYAEAVEADLGPDRIAGLREGLAGLRAAVDARVAASPAAARYRA